MGAAGAGKTTVGRSLAETLGWAFLDADNLHSPQNVEKMRGGVPLTDADRAPWLERVREAIAQALGDGRNTVVACSALRASYRAMLNDVAGEVRFVHLEASEGVLKERVARRVDHFAPAELVTSQLATLEAPTDALVLDAAQPVPALVRAIRSALTI